MNLGKLLKLSALVYSFKNVCSIRTYSILQGVSKTVKGLKINVLARYKLSCFLDAGIKEDTPGSETNNLIIHGICHFYFPVRSHQVTGREMPGGCCIDSGFVLQLTVPRYKKL